MSDQILRRTLTATLILGVALTASACSAPGGGGASDNTLTVTAFDDDDVAVLKEVGKLFTEEHSGWKVNVTQIPEADYVTKLRLSGTAGSPPDVAYVYAKGEVVNFQPLDDIVYADHDLDPDDLNRAILDYSCGFEGELYCVGGYAGTVMLYYNKAAFDAAGVAYPSSTVPLTFEQYAELADQLTQPGDSGQPPVVWGGDAAYPFSYTDPGTFMSSDGKTLDLTNAENEETWSQLVGMIDDGNSPSPTDLSSTSAADLLAEGKIAMSITDNFSTSRLDAAGIDWGVAPTPVQPGEEPWVAVWTNAFGIPSKAAHPEEAADFLALLATDGQTIQAERGYMPLNVEEAAATFGAASPAQAQVVEVSQLAREGTFTPNLFAWLGPLYDAWTAVGTDRSSVPDALAEAQEKAQPQLDNTWKTWDDILNEEK